MHPNPYQSPRANSPETPSEEPAGPSRFAWLGHIVILAFLAVLLLGIWFDGTTIHGRDYYKHEHGAFGYYIYESVNRVVTKSHYRPRALVASVAVSVVVVILAISDIRKWLKERRDHDSPCPTDEPDLPTDVDDD